MPLAGGLRGLGQRPLVPQSQMSFDNLARQPVARDLALVDVLVGQLPVVPGVIAVVEPGVVVHRPLPRRPQLPPHFPEPQDPLLLVPVGSEVAIAQGAEVASSDLALPLEVQQLLAIAAPHLFVARAPALREPAVRDLAREPAVGVIWGERLLWLHQLVVAVYVVAEVGPGGVCVVAANDPCVKGSSGPGVVPVLFGRA